MTPEDQQHAVRLAMGYTCISRTIRMTLDAQPIHFQLWRSSTGGGMERDLPPDYLKDLNACHEMEKTLSPDQDDDYEYKLGCLVADLDPEIDHTNFTRDLIISYGVKANAAHRCEAFLRALKLWQS